MLTGKLQVRLPLAALILLGFSLPFELDTPLWQFAGLSVTNVELLLFLTLGLTAVTLLQSPQKWVLPGRSWWWLALFVGGMLLAALLAPRLQENAFKAAWRLISGILLALAVMQIVRRPEDGRLLSIALLAGGLVAALIGWWEIIQAELVWMAPFRSHITRVGSFLRLTGPFDYANQAAMFIEATLPFLVAAGWAVSRGNLPRRTRYPLLGLLFIMTLFYIQASVLTLSRASFGTTIVVCLLLAALLAIRRPTLDRRMAKWWLGLAVVTAVLTVSNTLLGSQLRLRLQAGNVDNWYRTHIVAPPVLEVAAGTILQVPVTVTNEGALVWRSQGENPISLGARWINQADNRAYGEPRWPFPGSVRPQQAVEMSVPLSAPPEPGTYELRWDVVHEHVTWFGSKSGLFATSQVTVTPSEGQAVSVGIVGSEQAAWAYTGPVPDRATLWKLALRMIRERPLLGIGLDNFRLVYGERLDTPYFDKTVHTNNFYLELLVSLGLIGTVPFLIWLAALLIDVLRTLRRPDVTMWQAALAACLLAFVVHGLFDFFLLFNVTGLLFWLLVGLWLGEKRHHAHRI